MGAPAPDGAAADPLPPEPLPAEEAEVDDGEADPDGAADDASPVAGSAETPVALAHGWVRTVASVKVMSAHCARY